MTTIDMFAVDCVLDGTPMNLAGGDLEAAVMALLDHGHTYTVVADRCRISERHAKRIAGAVRARQARRAA